jgi:hypothetical protein
VFSIPLVLIGMVFFSSARVRRDCFAGIGPTAEARYSRWSGWVVCHERRMVVCGAQLYER